MKKVSIRIEYILSVIIAGVLTVFLLADSERIDSAFYPGLLTLGIFIFQTIRRKMDVIQLISKTTLSDNIISLFCNYFYGIYSGNGFMDEHCLG